MMEQEKIGAFIRELRHEKGLTQEALAEKLGVSQRSVSRWETGKTLPDYALLPALCEALEVNAAELLNARRIQGDQVSKQDVSAAIRSMIALTVRKKGLRRLVGALVSAVLTLVCMLGLYAMEFSVSVDSTRELEQAINEYHFHEEISADVLERKALGNRLYVLYGEKDCPGACGLACLEKGLLGRYRFLGCDDSDSRWITALAVTVGKKQYCVSFGVNDLPGVDAYGICGGRYRGGENVSEPDLGLPVWEEYPGAPFLKLTEVDTDIALWTLRIKFFSQGEEIPYSRMEAMYGSRQMEGAPHSSYGTAELWLVYVLEFIIFVLGSIFVRYFLTEDPQGKTQGLPG